MIPHGQDKARSMSKRLKRTLFFIAKVLLAGILLGYVISKVHWSDYYLVVNGQRLLVRGFASTILHADPYFLTGAFVCFLVPMLIISLRWRYLLKVQGIVVPLWEIVKVTFLGTFFINVADVNTDIQDMGYTYDFDDIGYSPSEGWSSIGWTEVIDRHTYIIWTNDNHFAKLRVININGTSSVEFQWAYQTDTGNPELARPQHDEDYLKRTIDGMIIIK